MHPLKFLPLFYVVGLLVLGGFLFSGCVGNKIEETPSEDSQSDTVVPETTEATETAESSDNNESEGIDSANPEGGEYDSEVEKQKIEAALESSDVEDCEAIGNSTAREACIANLTITAARYTEDSSIFDTLQEESKETCLAVLGSKLD